MFHLRFPLKKARYFLLFSIILSSLIMLNACKEEKLAKYVFLFIGDGASYAQKHLAELYGKEALFSNTLPVQGFITAAAEDSNIADTAAAASAISTGTLVPNGAVSMLSEGEEELPLITSLAGQNGYNVGIITDMSLDGPVPAAFYARSLKKQNYYDIAVQLKNSKVSLAAGGAFKRPKSFKKEDLETVLRQSGFKQLSAVKETDKLPSGKVVAAVKNIPFAIDASSDAPTLSLFVKKALEKFGTEKGFFLVVSGSKINEAAEMHDTAAMMRQIRAFDDAVKTAYAFYEQHPDETLIIVTGTSETGGLSLGADRAEKLDVSVFEQQKISADAFKSAINRFRRRRQAGAVLEDFMPQIEKNFGLRILSKEAKKELREKAKAGDEDAAKALMMEISSAELSFLREAFRYSMMDSSKRPKTEAYLNKYGSCDPLQIAPVQILARRAGIEYTTFGQTAAPLPVAVVGNGAYFFTGSYPQTGLFGKILTAMGITVPGTVQETETEAEPQTEETPVPADVPASATVLAK